MRGAAALVALGCALAACGAEPPAAVDAAVSADAGGAEVASVDVPRNPGGLAAPDDLVPTLAPLRGPLPALAAAVWRGERLIAVGAVGVRKQGDDTPALVSDRWHLGSDTKAMTATLVGLAVDRGKLRFEDTLATLFAGESVAAAYRDVTLEQLLQHRGGAPAEMPADVLERMFADGDAPEGLMNAARGLLALAPAQAPGTFVYANAGYMLAGAALERALGSTWQALMRRELFAPLGMSSCGFGAPGTAGTVDEPRGHAVEGERASPIEPGPDADNPPALGPAGTVHCTLADWGRFLTVHLGGAQTLLAPATLRRLHTPPAPEGYAAGWGVTSRPWAGGLALTHAGSNTLWFATAWLAPAKNLAMAVVTNRGDDVAAAIVDTTFGALIGKYAP